ncbi:hypothetical protein [Natrialba chahannaoensis]|uniref:hypothetical protein n=1 Tax=Natrialba chahannaoensis TaxID=68911 RepID=UPI001269665A|nr:hypothetical protein [Natrialba chahannaoensis]
MTNRKSRRKLLSGIGTTAIGLGMLSTTTSAVGGCEGEFILEEEQNMAFEFDVSNVDSINFEVYNTGSEDMDVYYWRGEENYPDNPTTREFTVSPGDSYLVRTSNVTEDVFNIYAVDSSGSIEWEKVGGEC